MNEFEDIEQLLKPQCEFKASETLKQEVMQKAREEIHPHRIVKMWPWLAAACVVGFMLLLLMPPKSTTDGEQPVATVETTKTPATKQTETIPEPTTVRVETQQRPKAQKPRKKVKKPKQPEPQEEPVQMSEETRMELLLASLNEDEPRMEDISTEEEIRQMRMRGERLVNIYKAIDN